MVYEWASFNISIAEQEKNCQYVISTEAVFPSSQPILHPLFLIWSSPAPSLPSALTLVSPDCPGTHRKPRATSNWYWSSCLSTLSAGISGPNHLNWLQILIWGHSNPWIWMYVYGRIVCNTRNAFWLPLAPMVFSYNDMVPASDKIKTLQWKTNLSYSHSCLCPH